MTRADDVPGDNILVFTRMTFTGARLETTAVYLHPDDGHLEVRRTDDPYVVSDGQLVVRALGTTTLLTPDRTPGGLVVRNAATGSSITLRAADPAEAFDPALLGAWTGTGDGHTWAFRFDADGRATIQKDDDGRSAPYAVAGPYLLVDRDAYRFTFVGGGLILDNEDAPLALERIPAEARPPRVPTLTD